MIKCFKCKNEVSDLVSSTCRHCGYSVSQSKENWIKLENAPPAQPIAHFDFDIEADRDALYEIIVPAILDEAQHYDVKINVRKHFRKFDDIASGSGDCLTENIEKFVAFQVKVYDYSKKKNADQAEFALRTYKKQMDSIETPGLGFDIITNDAASAIAYTALNRHEVSKQYLKQANAAANQLVANLPFLTSDSMQQSDIFEYKHQIDQSLLLAQKLVDSNNYLADHPEFYSEPDQYDTGLTIGEHSIYDILRSITVPQKGISGTKKVLGVPAVPQEIIDKMIDEGYLHQLGERYYTSTKYERETLQALYWKKHPDEKRRVMAEKVIASQNAYQEAENLYSCEKYYESAVAFNAIAGYQDSAQRSIQIWNEKVLVKDRIAIHYSTVVGLHENGTVFVSGKSGNRNITDSDMRMRVGQWNNITAISVESLPCGLGLDGKIYALTGTHYYAPSMPCVVSDMRGWENIVSFVSDYSVLVALDQTGKVYATGSNDNHRCDVSGWSNVKKLILNHWHTLGLTQDGNVLATGTFDKNVAQALSNNNVVDIYYLGSDSDDNTYAGLQENGKLIVLGAQAGEYAFLGQWEPISKLIQSSTISDDMYGIIHKAVIGLTQDGRILCESKSEILKRELRKWDNIVDLVCENGFIGLRADGTVVTFLYKHNLSNWKNVVGIFASSYCVIGICADGTVLSAGECNTAEINCWKLFSNVNTRDKQREQIKKQQIEMYQKQLDSCRNELSNLHGFFSGAKRKKLEAHILELESKLT